MKLRLSAASILCSLALAAAVNERAGAVSCTTQAEMKDGERAALVLAAHDLAQMVVANDADGLKARTIASVAANFDAIANSIHGVSGMLTGASLRVSAVYALDASSAAPGQDEVQFFCGQAANASHVSFAIPQLPPGRYACAILEATGVKDPQRLAMLLENVGGAAVGAGMNAAPASWELAGFFPHPLLEGGHDGVWYWQKARELHNAAQNFNAYFYYQTAQSLLLPADFLGSSNLDKLAQEATAIAPTGLPGTQPMVVHAGGNAYPVTNLHTDASLTGPGGGIDLVISYDAADVSDPVQARARTVALMKAMLASHPEVRSGFHGLWVYANASTQRPFSLELPMSQIDTQP